MEMEVDVIIDKIFTKFYLKIRVKGKWISDVFQKKVFQ